MVINNWAESFSNNLELCVYIGKNWVILKDGTNQKGLYKKIDASNPKYKGKMQFYTEFNNEYYESICDLPSLYFEGEEFEGGVIIHANAPKTKVCYIIGNRDKTPVKIENPNLIIKKDENLITFYDTDSNEEISIYDTYSFSEITKNADGQIGFNF